MYFYKVEYRKQSTLFNPNYSFILTELHMPIIESSTQFKNYFYSKEQLVKIQTLSYERALDESHESIKQNNVCSQILYTHD